MKAEYLIQSAINPALALLPVEMSSQTARTIMLAIAYQESGLAHRKQINGPALGYFQFEQYGGVYGVLRHSASKSHIQRVLVALDYDPDSSAAICHGAIQHNDILAAAFARLLLWTDPFPLPDDVSGAWSLYLRTWRPGKPHPGTWSANYAKATEALDEYHRENI